MQALIILNTSRMKFLDHMQVTFSPFPINYVTGLSDIQNYLMCFAAHAFPVWFYERLRFGA